MSDFARLVVLISGTGSNLQAILDACQSGDLSAQVVAVISNKPDVYGLVRVARAGIPTVALEKTKEQDRRAYDALLADKVAAFDPDLVVLAGWMRILTSAFLNRFPNRVINLHPALPGTFPGMHAIERAYEAWQKGEIDRTGVMVHLVPDECVDVGPVLATREILFQPGELLHAFEERVHIVEHQLLVETIKNLLNQSTRKSTKKILGIA
jgi:formyltetrahydrofolate-dependent phosphoribosylglycinamide formyltransferase